MKEKAIGRINKVGKIGRIISKIMRVFAIIGFVGIIIGESILLFLPSNLFDITISSNMNVNLDNGAIAKLSGGTYTTEQVAAEFNKYAKSGTLDVGDEEFALKTIEVVGNTTRILCDSVENKSIRLTDIRIALALYAVVIAGAYVLLLFVGKLCVALETCETPFSELVITSLTRFAYTLLGYVLVAVPLGAFSAEQLSSSASASLHIDLSSVLIALAVYGLTVVFKYGACLQQESDETL